MEKAIFVFALAFVLNWILVLYVRPILKEIIKQNKKDRK